jgi:hypothetical protein
MPHTTNCILHTAHRTRSQTPNSMSLGELMWIYTNQNNFIQMCMNLHEYLHDCIQFYFKLFELFWIHTNLNKHVLNLFENMHAAALPHTAALPDSRTLPRALPRALPHPAARNAPRNATHCRIAGQSNTAARTAGQPHTAAHSAAHCCTTAHCMN